MIEYKMVDLGNGITELCGFDGECCKYVVEGSQRACLVDTGMGGGDLRAAVRSITDKPLVVVNTHGHIDHCIGNSQFEQVWMSPKAHWDVDSALAELASMPAPQPDPDDARLTFDYERLPLGEGDVIDLGDRVLEVFETPGHTPGDLCFLDSKSRLLFVGDVVSTASHCAHMLAYLNDDIRFSTMSMGTWIRSMKRLVSMSDRFDAMLTGHDEQPVGKVYLDRLIELAQSILDGTAEPFHPQLPPNYGGLLCWKVEGDDVAVLYHDEIVHD